MIHNIRYRLFVYENENEEKLVEGLKNILPTAKPERELAEGVTENPITILSGKINKKKETKKFMNSLLVMEEEKIAKLAKDFEKKIDKNGNLFLRFSKLEACENNWEILDSGDSIHLKVKIAAYPAKKEIAIDLLNKIINDNEI